MKLNSILSLSPSSIYGFLKNNPEQDLPLIIHYWKLGLLEKYNTEDVLFKKLLDYGYGQHDNNDLIEGLLGSEIIKNINVEKDPLFLVLKSHLIFENFIDYIFKKNNFDSKGFSFYAKVFFLNKRNLLEEDIYHDLLQLNNIRNEYAHNYYFDIASYDMSRFSVCKGLYDGLPISKKSTRGVLNVKVLQFYIIYHVLGRMSYDFPFLNKLKVQKLPTNEFFKEGAGDKIGKIISEASRLTRNTRLGVRVKLEIYEKDPKGEKSKVLKQPYEIIMEVS